MNNYMLRMMEISVNSTRLFLEKAGTGAPLILLHGNGESHEIFREAIPLLAQKFTVYAADTRGHGQSLPAAEYHYGDMAMDLIGLAEALELEKPAVYGFSDGGIAALIAAVCRPDLFSRIALGGVNLSPKGLTKAFLKETRLRYRQTGDKLLKLMLKEPKIPLRALARVCVPVLLLAGEHDLVRPRHTQKIAAALPDCTLRILRGETHESYTVHSEKIALLLENFFRSGAAGV